MNGELLTNGRGMRIAIDAFAETQDGVEYNVVRIDVARDWLLGDNPSATLRGLALLFPRAEIAVKPAGWDGADDR